MVRAVWVFRHGLCWRLYRLSARTVEHSNLPLLVYNDRRLPDPVRFLEVL